MPTARHPRHSRITDDLKKEIVAEFKKEPSRDRSQLARKFGVAPDTVSAVLKASGYGYTNACKSCGKLNSLSYSRKVKLLDGCWHAQVKCSNCSQFNWSCARKFTDLARDDITKAKESKSKSNRSRRF